MEYYHNDKSKIIDEIKTKGVDVDYNITMQEIPGYIADISETNLQEKEVTITENGTTTVEPDEEHNGLTSVSITTNIATESTEAIEKDVNFYDYDGFRLYSYTKDEFLALDKMPEQPEHSGLVGAGWTRTLTEAKAYTTAYGICDLGSYYNTNDGSTRIYIKLYGGRLTPRVYFGINGNGTLNWGDESEEEELTGGTGTSYAYIYKTHTYSKAGIYKITIKPEQGGHIYITGSISGGTDLITDNRGTTSVDTVYRNSVIKLELGNNTKIDDNSYAFKNLQFLETITIPETIVCRYIELYMCSNLKCLVYPKGITTLGKISAGGSNISRSINSLRLIFPEGITSTPSSNLLSNGAQIWNLLLPNSCATIVSSFKDNYSNIFGKLIIPNTVTDLTGFYVIYGLNISYVNVPTGATTIKEPQYKSLPYISKLVFPATVESISTNFMSNTALKCYDFTALTAVPTLTATSNLFANCATDCKIVVPDSLYETWVASDNWSTVSSKIVKASEYTE